MNQSLKECGQRMISTISRPQVRHTMHYECGLYESPEAQAPLASVRANNDFVMPLVKVFAIVGASVLACAALKSTVNMISCAKQRACCKDQTC